MCEQTEINYLDGDVVWVKLGSCWWPGEVVAPDKLPPDVLPSFKKPPIAVVKFFQEDTYEYVKNINSIYKYNCSRKNEFINKGLYMYRTKHGHMEKFPEDVIRAETAVGGDMEILTRDEFQETKKESYAGIFGDPRKTPASNKKGKGKGGRLLAESPQVFHPIRKMKEKTDYRVHILVQGSKTPSTTNEASETSETKLAPSTSATEPNFVESKSPEITQNDNKPVSSVATPGTPSGAGQYACHACSFSTTRLNVLILHNKTHSVSFVPYTPSPVRKKPVTKPQTKSTPTSSKSPTKRKPRTEKSDKPKKQQTKKRASDDKTGGVEVKKPKTDEEIKSSLLADWDDGEEESNDESSTSNMASSRSPEVAIGAESPAAPTPAELPTAQIPDELLSVPKKKTDSSPSTEKPESSSDSKYEFCEDEDWPVEADAGRKIPRVKNPKRTDETKSLSLDEDDVAREVAELLNKTSVPELPSVPESLKVEENFPEPSIVKSPDKKRDKTPEKVADKPTEQQPTKAIFKTKTFFRSRHSRSQDAIGKYVAEQLNAVERERMDINDCDINGSDAVSSPEARESPPIEPVKITRLAPKIQLKKMKAEAAQLREKEKNNYDISTDLYDMSYVPDVVVADSSSIPESPVVDDSKNKENDEALPKQLENLTHLTQEPEKIIDAAVVDTDVVNNAFTDKEEPSAKLDQKVNNEVNEQKETQIEIEKMSEIESFSESPQKKTDITTETTPNPYMNESTASAVDALLSVSREADRVTKTISNDLPEDLFEDDNAPGEQEEITLNRNGQSENAEITNEFVENGQSNENAELPNEFMEHETSQPKTQDNIKTINSENIESEEIVLDESQTSEDIVMKDVSLNLDNSKPVLEENEKGVSLNIDNSKPVLEENEKDVSLNIDNSKPVLEENVPSESDLQIAEALINLPASAMLNKTTELNQNLAPMAFEAAECIEEEVTLDNQEEIVTLNNQEEIIPFNNEEETVTLSNQEEIIPFSSQEEIVTMSECAEETVIEEKAQPNEVETNFEEPQTDFASNNDAISNRFESELEKSENLNAAQSLVQMSESIEHKVGAMDTVNNEEVIESDAFTVKTNNGIDSKINSVEQTLAKVLSEKIIEPDIKPILFDSTPSKLLKILEEPPKPRNIPSKVNPKQIILQGKEKILNFDVAKSSFKSKPQSPKQKIIIRRTTPSKNVINNMNEKMGQEKIILSRTGNLSQESPSVKTYTIQTAPDPPSDANTIIIQQKIRKITTPKPPPKLQKVKQQTSLVAPVTEVLKPVTEVLKPVTETITTDDAMFDINSMPIVLSDDLLTPESIEKMPVMMADANIITHTQAPKLVKSKPTIVETEKISVTSSAPKPELKRLLLNPVGDSSKTSSPNILSKSSKLRGAKPLLIIDRTTGKQKIVMGKETIPKEIKPAPTLIQAAPQITKQTHIIKQAPQAPKSEKFIILPTQNQPRPTRTQKIVIDPQTGKAHVIVAKSNEPPMTSAENKPVSAKLVASNSDASAPGNTVMIITNAQGTQSRIVLTPEHEKILFPNKQQPNVSQLKTITHRITTNSPTPKKIITTMGSIRATATPPKPPARIVPKQKSAIITSKGQLIVGGRVATTAQNIAPMPEIRPVAKARPAPEPKKIVQTVPKTNTEPIIFLQQKSGAVMQLTAAQFEHLQRTGQIVQKTTVPQEKVIIQKTKTVSEASGSAKARVRKAAGEAPTPLKKLKQQEVAIAPAPAPAPLPVPALVASLPALVPALPALVPALSPTPAPPPVPSASNTVSISTEYNEFENFEELLPSTAIARQLPEPPAPAPPPPAAEPTAPLSDGQLLAVPGEHFGGPAGTFYLCVEDGGTFTPIDNRPLVLENNQLVPMTVETVAVPAQPERRDILEAALANSDVFDGRDEAPDFRDLNANVSVNCRVSETSTTLNQPIMTPVEVPTAGEAATVPPGLDAGLAALGVTPTTVPTSLDLPITVTDPRIASRVSDPLAGAASGYSLVSVGTEPAVSATAADSVISMPLLTEEESVENGRSMPILEAAPSSVESVGSPASPEDAVQWPHPRRLLTPASDTSDTSAEIPLQPQLQLQMAVDDLTTHT